MNEKNYFKLLQKLLFKINFPVASLGLHGPCVT